MDYVIINNKKSTEITGLLITAFSAIRKPKMRTLEETVQGKDGSEVINLGYEAYTRRIEIGLSFNYNIDEVIEYFNQSGEITFSNELDKIYKFKQIKEIDFEKLLRFKTAIVEILVQPFKKERNEEEQNATTKFSNASGSAITLKDSEQAQFKNLKFYGKSWQYGEPTPKEPKEIHDFYKPKIEVCGENLIKDITSNCFSSYNPNAITFDALKNGTIRVKGNSNKWNYTAKKMTLPKGSYWLSGCPKGGADKTYNCYVLVDGTYYFDYGEGVEFEIKKRTELDFYIARVGFTGEVDLVFKPMLSKLKPKRFSIYQTGGTITIPYALRGVPVKANGNYTDKDGQEWVADYVDFEKGVLVKNVEELKLSNCTKKSVYNGNGVYLGGLLKKTTSFKQGYCKYGKIEQTKTKGDSSFWVGDNDFGVYWIGVLNYFNNSIDDFSKWLKKEDVTLTLESSQKEEIPLTPEELNAYKQLTTLYPFTSILNTHGAFMEVEYQKQSIVINKGNTTARPIIYLEGSGKQEIYINNNLLLTVDLKGGGNITIDTEEMEAYDEKGLRNRDVDGDYNNVVLKKGENSVKVTGNCTKCTLKNVSRWL